MKIAFCCVLAFGVIGGCGGHQRPERAVVSGTVTLNGEPIPKGGIQFIPTATTDAPVNTATIDNGAYLADARGGLLVGTYRIEIYAYRDNPEVREPKPDAQLPRALGSNVPRRQYLDKRHNADSQLTITIEQGQKTVVKNVELIE